MNDLKWICRPFLAGLALVLWVVTYWGTSELPPEFLTGLVGTAWVWVFASREKEKQDVAKAKANNS